MNLTSINTARFYGLNLTDIQILLLLAEHGPMDMGTLTVEIGLTGTAITAAAKKLIAKALITRVDRRRDRFIDRRIVTLALCELGRIRLQQLTGRFPEPASASA